MVYLRKKRCPVGIYHKLQAKKVGPCRILYKINDNAYVVYLAFDLQISNTVNVADLYEYHPPDNASVDEVNSESSSSHVGGRMMQGISYYVVFPSCYLR